VVQLVDGWRLGVVGWLVGPAEPGESGGLIDGLRFSRWIWPRYQLTGGDNVVEPPAKRVLGIQGSTQGLGIVVYSPVHQRIVDEGLQQGQQSLALLAHHLQHVFTAQPEGALQKTMGFMVNGDGIYG